MTISPAQPEQILKALGKVWTSLGEEEKQQGQPTVLRACTMTLIAATDEADDGYFASQTIAELMHEHPSRGVVLAVSDDANKAFEARVLAQCWKPFGKAQQICCEQIEIGARSQDWPNVGPTLVGIIAADLPVVFWCRHQGALSAGATDDQKNGLLAIMDLSSKTIIDTRELEAKAAFQLMARWRSEHRTIADLEWTRVTPWREPIAHIFDNATRQNNYAAFKNIEVTYTNESPCLSALYIGGWLSAPYKAKVSFARAEGYGAGIHSIVLRSAEETITFERTGLDCMTLRSTNGRSRRYGYADAPSTALMTEELSVIGSDPAFDTAFVRAGELLNEL